MGDLEDFVGPRRWPKWEKCRIWYQWSCAHIDSPVLESMPYTCVMVAMISTVSCMVFLIKIWSGTCQVVLSGTWENIFYAMSIKTWSPYKAASARDYIVELPICYKRHLHSHWWANSHRYTSRSIGSNITLGMLRRIKWVRFLYVMCDAVQTLFDTTTVDKWLSQARHLVKDFIVSTYEIILSSCTDEDSAMFTSRYAKRFSLLSSHTIKEPHIFHMWWLNIR